MDLEPIPVIAWVESPLQLVGVAEWAAVQRRRVPIAGRLTPQMSETTDELIARSALFGRCEPYLGIPWNLLARHRHWLVGDGFSGQFRLAAAVLRPQRITFLDDGSNAIAFADTLTGKRPFARPGVRERGLTTRVAPFAFDVIAGRAREGQVDFFTAFDFGSARAYVTSTAGRVLLGSARPVDGRMPLEEYLEWVRLESARAPVTYLPHRREPDSQLAAVGAIAGIHVERQSLPVEMLLAGAIERLDSALRSTPPWVGADRTGPRS